MVFRQRKYEGLGKRLSAKLTKGNKAYVSELKIAFALLNSCLSFVIRARSAGVERRVRLAESPRTKALPTRPFNRDPVTAPSVFIIPFFNRSGFLPFFWIDNVATSSTALGIGAPDISVMNLPVNSMCSARETSTWRVFDVKAFDGVENEISSLATKPIQVSFPENPYRDWELS